jgi:soluble lytic murein transglycosylase-like protein
VIGSAGSAVNLPLGPSWARGRFSRPAGRFHFFVPIVLSLGLTVSLWRGLAILGPRFLAVRSSAAGLVLPLDQARGLDTGSHTLGGLSPVFSAEVRRWEPSIERWSAEYSLPADLIAVVMQIESCGDPKAVSSAGALGLFQVMPYHFLPDDDPIDVETNAARGLSYLAGGLRMASGDPRRALAGYNGGHGVIGLPDPQWASETQRYVTWGVGILQDARAGLASSPTLADWLSSGGARLCRQAAQRDVGR